MSAVKAVQRKAGRKVARVKEKQAVYAIPTTRTKKAVPETHIEFHMMLPENADINQFTDDLIKLVEAYHGSLGGGTSSQEESK
jgi:hypothetical protein